MYKTSILVIEDSDIKTYGSKYQNVKEFSHDVWKESNYVDFVIYKNKVLKNKTGKTGNIHSKCHNTVRRGVQIYSFSTV
jgi:hypothetical protein